MVSDSISRSRSRRPCICATARSSEILAVTMRWFLASGTSRTSPIRYRQHRSFMHIGYTIGGMMVFPANRVNGRMTINGARGCHPRIRDRFDLTVECIRRHYLDEKPNPLGKTLALYNDFFELFGDFVGYVEFFLLQDLVDEVTSTVEFMMPFDNFTTSPVPGTQTLTVSTVDARLTSLNGATAGSPLIRQAARRDDWPHWAACGNRVRNTERWIICMGGTSGHGTTEYLRSSRKTARVGPRPSIFGL